MASEIRVNSITNRSGLTTTTWNDEGLDVVGVATAKNQLHNLSAWIDVGFLEYVGVYNNKKILKSINKILPMHERKKRSKIGKRNLDGKGAKRVCNLLLNYQKRKD